MNPSRATVSQTRPGGPGIGRLDGAPAGGTADLLRAVVVTVKLLVAEVDPGVTGLAENMPVLAAGSVELDRVTGLPNAPPDAATVIVNVAAAPAATVCAPLGLLTA